MLECSQRSLTSPLGDQTERILNKIDSAVNELHCSTNYKSLPRNKVDFEVATLTSGSSIVDDCMSSEADSCKNASFKRPKSALGRIDFDATGELEEMLQGLIHGKRYALESPDVSLTTPTELDDTICSLRTFDSTPKKYSTLRSSINEMKLSKDLDDILSETTTSETDYIFKPKPKIPVTDIERRLRAISNESSSSMYPKNNLHDARKIINAPHRLKKNYFPVIKPLDIEPPTPTNPDDSLSSLVQPKDSVSMVGKNSAFESECSYSPSGYTSRFSKVTTSNVKKPRRATSLSPTRKSQKKNSRFNGYIPRTYTSLTTDDIGSYTEEERDIIKDEAAKLKSLYASERNKRRPSLDSITQTAANPALEQNRALSNLSRDVQNTLALKETNLEELNVIQNKLNIRKDELREIESKLRNLSLKKKEESRITETLKYKKEKLESDLRILSKEMLSTKSQWNNKLELNTQEIMKIIEERDHLKMAHQRGEINYIERMEFEKQVEIYRNELADEQSSSRMKFDAYEDELREAERKINEYDTINKNLLKKIGTLESLLLDKEKQLEKQNNDYKIDIESQKRQYDSLNAQFTESRHQIIEKDQENKHQQNIIAELRIQIEEFKRTLSRMNERIEQMHEEKQTALNSQREDLLRKTEMSLSQLEEKANLERTSIDRKHELDLHQLEKKFQGELEIKDKEIESWNEKLLKQEQSTREVCESLRSEAQEQVRSALNREKLLWEEEQLRLIKRERDMAEEQLQTTINRMNDNIDYEKQQNSNLQRNIRTLREDIDELRLENKQLHKEATDALITARESVFKDHQNELSKLRDDLLTQKNEEVEKLKNVIGELKSQLESITSEKCAIINHTAEYEKRMMQHEKTILIEINDECRKISQMAELNWKRMRKRSPERPKCLKQEKGPLTSQVTDSLVTLKVYVSELQAFIYDIKEENEKLTLRLQQLKEEKDLELQHITDQLSISKEREVDICKENLIHGHVKEIQMVQEAMQVEQEKLQNQLKGKDQEMKEIRKNMSQWKQDVAQKLARSFDKEVAEATKKKMTLEGMVPREVLLEQQKQRISLQSKINELQVEKAPDSSTMMLLKHLQDRVKNLKDENCRLRSDIQNITQGSIR